MNFIKKSHFFNHVSILKRYVPALYISSTLTKVYVIQIYEILFR